MDDKNRLDTCYQIDLLETLDEHWQRILPEAVIESGGQGMGSRLQVQLSDQSALRGFMNALWNYNLSVLKLCRMDICSPQANGQAEKEV